MKRLFLFIFVALLCLPSPAFAADPLKTHDGGFGPAIGGLQLGQHMTWQEAVKRRTSRTGPYSHIFSIYIAYKPGVIRFFEGGMEARGDYIEIHVNGNRATVSGAGKVAQKLPKQGTLDDYFAVTEKNKMNYVSVGNIVMYNGRVIEYSLFASEIKAPYPSTEKFAQWLSTKYNLGQIEKKKESYEVSNPSEGWLVVVKNHVMEVSCIPIPGGKNK